MSNPPMRLWKHRLLGFVLLIAYAPAFVIPMSTVALIYSGIANTSGSWPFALGTLGSAAAVTAALFTVIVRPRGVAPKTLFRLQIFLVVYWLPHTILVTLWHMLRSPGAWIE